MKIPSRPCQGITLATGDPCSQPAKKGKDFCRFHLPVPPESSPGPVASPRSTAQHGNANARTHGAYSPPLLPEELPLYEEKREAFTAALGTVDVFDEQIVHLLALISVKVDAAMMRGAHHAAYGRMIKQILDLMKELKATRASKDPVDTGRNLTFADLFAALKAHFDQQEQGQTESRKREDRSCARCRQQGPHELTSTGAWQCQNCGAITEITTLPAEGDGE